MKIKQKKAKKNPIIDKSKAISEKYNELEQCCSILKYISYDDLYTFRMHSGGWKVWQHQITNAGIDIDKIYDFIRDVTEKRKLEIEHELSILNA